ncbi:hypothetical protein NCCP2222_13270 [Sporosarcina sp. NCCP-2222]|uniref:hypothetical protein n=1 Tax=Sporosarcina sp. NCCP-2222 TaxID=2935073 RepID=UPI00208BF5CB|nr:hypothetical protein [Sporosarcina sp. NCCP-2222]GKV55380.1 hypothetical protein NCCP2222_13270 [Sporosarcina sp. NCCP-2222]
MFRLKNLVLLIFLVSVLTGCQLAEVKNEVPIEMVAFGSLTDEEQKLFPASPKDSTIRKVSVTEEIEPFLEKDYEQDEVYMVTFHNTETDLGELSVFVGADKKTVIGKGFISKP